MNWFKELWNRIFWPHRHHIVCDYIRDGFKCMDPDCDYFISREDKYQELLRKQG